MFGEISSRLWQEKGNSHTQIFLTQLPLTYLTSCAVLQNTLEARPDESKVKRTLLHTTYKGECTLTSAATRTARTKVIAPGSLSDKMREQTKQLENDAPKCVLNYFSNVMKTS